MASGCYTIFKSLGSFLTHSGDLPVISSTATNWAIQYTNNRAGLFTISICDEKSSMNSLALTLVDEPISGDGSREIILKPLEAIPPDTQLWRFANIATRSEIVPGASTQIFSIAEENVLIAEEGTVEEGKTTTRRVRAYPDIWGMTQHRWTLGFEKS